MGKVLNEKQLNRLAGKLEQLEPEQFSFLFAETMRRKIAAAAQSAITIDEIFSTKEAADLVRVSDETVRRWCHEHGIGVQVGPTWVVSGLRLKTFIESDDGKEALVGATTSKMPDAPHHPQKKRA